MNELMMTSVVRVVRLYEKYSGPDWPVGVIEA